MLSLEARRSRLQKFLDDSLVLGHIEAGRYHYGDATDEGFRALHFLTVMYEAAMEQEEPRRAEEIEALMNWVLLNEN